MKKAPLIYALMLTLLLTSCGNREIDDELSSEDLETTTETVVNNETISTTAEPKIVTKLSSEDTEIQLEVGETVQLYYTLEPETTPEEYRTIEWSSTDDTIVTVDANGLLTGVDSGMCTVVATSKNNPDVVLKYSVTVTGSVNVSQAVLGSTISVPTSKFTTTTIATTTTATVATTTQTEVQDTTEVPDDTQTSQEDLDATDATENVQPTYINNILIVNSNYPLSRDYQPNSWGSYGLLEEVQQAFDTMNADAVSEGLSLQIYSGYVSYDEQSNKYQNAVNSYGQDYADRYVDKAGYSESQTGLTIFLNSANSEFDSTAEASWIAENCYKYGFVVRYPQGKEDRTGKSYRSYQIRYVGVAVATDMHNSNLCLEEYLNA